VDLSVRNEEGRLLMFRKTSNSLNDNILKRGRIMQARSIERGKIGIFSVGHVRYWEQFTGLKERLEKYREYFETRVKGFGVEIVSAGLVDTVEKAYKAGDLFVQEKVDLIFCYVVTYTRSFTVLPVVQRAKAPMVLIGLQPTPGMDYAKATTAEQLANDNSTSMPEIAYALSRANIPINVVFGMLYEDARAWEKIKEWTQVATVLRTLHNAHIGFLGHAYPGMLDMYSDPTTFHVHFGIHIERLEMCDLKDRVDEVTEEEVKIKKKEIKEFFDLPAPGADPIAGPVTEESLEWSARVAVGIDKLVSDFHLEGFAYYYRGLEGSIYEKLVPGMIVGNSLLTGKGIPVAGEGDLKNCIAMLIMDRFGVGGSFCELHPADFRNDFVLIGHDGPGHIAISDEKPVLRGLSKLHGKWGFGASVEFKIKTGPITILGLTQTHEGKFKFVVAEGESVPGLIPATGNTNTRAKFHPDVVSFIEKWTEAAPTHHFALGIGHNISKIKKLAKVLGIEVSVVSEIKEEK